MWRKGLKNEKEVKKHFLLEKEPVLRKGLAPRRSAL